MSAHRESNTNHTPLNTNTNGRFNLELIHFKIYSALICHFCIGSLFLAEFLICCSEDASSVQVIILVNNILGYYNCRVVEDKTSNNYD